VVAVEEKVILDKVKHRRLIDNLPHIAETANVPQHMIKCSSKPYLTASELEWLANFRVYQDKGQGLVLTGMQSIAPDTKMMALAAALIRNFVDARVMSLGQVIGLMEDNEMPAPTVLLIPNLFAQSVGKALPDWKVQHVYDLLLQRVVAQKPTVAYVENFDALANVYGPPFAQHLQQHYKLA
jgi:hypothetical protein